MVRLEEACYRTEVQQHELLEMACGGALKHHDLAAGEERS